MLTSMDLSRRGLQTNGKLFFKFQTRFRIIDRKPKIFKRIARRDYCKKKKIISRSMDSSRQALQFNGKLSSNFEIIFELTTIFFQIIAA